MKKIRVMLVEDSLVIRTYLEHIIRRDPRLDLVESVGSAEEALRVLPKAVPDVISLDIRLPGMNGLEATLRIMSVQPTPIVVFAANVDSDELNISMNALRAGALAVIEKPVGVAGKDYEQTATRICDYLVSMSVVKLVRQRVARTLAMTGAPNINGKNPLKVGQDFQGVQDRYKVLGIVASTGGPNALVSLLSNLPSDFPLPILVVQHITASFVDSFATWLQGLCPFKVEIARDGGIPKPGHVYLPPAEQHLQLEAGRLTLSSGDMVCLQRPSGTVLFQSMAKTLGPRCLAVLLTGMGEDGAEGMREIYQAGGYTIAEDESSCVVYGMPAAAVRLKAVIDLLPLEGIAPRVIEVLKKSYGVKNDVI